MRGSDWLNRNISDCFTREMPFVRGRGSALLGFVPCRVKFNYRYTRRERWPYPEEYMEPPDPTPAAS